ncbi:hypothetical protein BASA81_002667 [Batrachochytrium salamandrivorans]|nr:hypothetical protein BASA81_002667 [Batrachochytrium salamandrivorans]
MSSLRQILSDPEQLKSFQDYCEVQHCKENLEFWLVVEQFKSFAPSSPSSPTSTLASVSSSPPESTSRAQSNSFDGSPVSPTTRKKPSMSTHLRLLMRSKSKLNLAPAPVSSSTQSPLQLAQQIFDEFLSPDSPNWLCHDHRISDRIKLSLSRGDLVDFTWFDTLQHKTFAEMEKDVVVRFNQAALGGEDDYDVDELERFETMSPRTSSTGGPFSPLNLRRHGSSSSKFFPDSKLRNSMLRLSSSARSSLATDAAEEE